MIKMIRLLVRFLNWLSRLVFGKPHVEPVYEEHIGFVGRERALLDDLLPLWHERIQERLDECLDNERLYWLKLKPVERVGGVGLFNGPLLVMPRGTVFGYYGGFLVKHDGMETGAYDLAIDLTCDFSRASQDHSIEAYVNGDPLLIRQHILATRINHSCRPNCEANYRNYVVTSRNKRLTLSFVFFEALRVIERGEELVFNYGPGYVVSRSAAIRRNAAFINCVCNGGRCYFRRVMLTE